MLDRVSKGCQETICQQMVIALTVWPAVARKKLYWFLFLTHNTNIRIRSFCVNSIVGLNVAECIVHPSSTTAIIAKLLWAINEILFTQRYKLSSFLEMLAFKRSRLENKKKKQKTKTKWKDINENMANTVCYFLSTPTGKCPWKWKSSWVY